MASIFYTLSRPDEEMEIDLEIDFSAFDGDIEIEDVTFGRRQFALTPIECERLEAWLAKFGDPDEPDEGDDDYGADYN